MRDQLGLGQLWLKDESYRFGLGAFKSIGGAYAVFRYLEGQIKLREPNAQVTPEALSRGEYQQLTEKLTVACASAGNHGRAVAWGAQLFGARCVVRRRWLIGPLDRTHLLKRKRQLAQGRAFPFQRFSR